MPSNSKTLTSEAQVAQSTNVQPIPVEFIQLANNLTPLALLILLAFVGKQFVDSLCHLVEAIKEK